jgi:hypothetical protein
MNLFNTIPPNILCRIFSEFLTLDCTCGFDTAVVNVNDRRFLEDLYKSPEFVFECNQEHSESSSPRDGRILVEWLIKRNISVRRINLSGMRNVRNDVLKLLYGAESGNPDLAWGTICRGTRLAINLVYLSLSECNWVTNACLNWLAKCCTKLRYLNLSDCKNIGLNNDSDALYRKLWDLENLEYLNLSFCEMVQEVGYSDRQREFDYDSASESNKQRFLKRSSNKLRFLELQLCKLVEYKCIVGISQCYLMLQHLNLSGCEKIIDSDIEILSKGCSLLESLNLCSCSKVSNWGITKLVDNCRLLRNLNLTFCEKVDDKSMELLSTLEELRTLNLCYCSQVTDSGFKKLSESCKFLQHLNLNFCTRLTVKGLYYLFEGFCTAV